MLLAVLAAWHREASRDLRRDALGVRGRRVRRQGGQTAAPRCRCLVIVDDLDYGRAFAGFAFGVHDLPDISSSFARKTVPHLDVTYRRFGVVALRAGIAERRWALA